MQKNILISVVIGLLIIGGAFYLTTEKPADSVSTSTAVAGNNNVEIKDGVQYVTINAKGGYSPKNSTIKPDMPTKLIVKTNGTYDCSSSLAIRSVGFQKILQSTGEEIIDIGTLAVGEKVQGVCSMGMFNFLVQAS